MRTVTTCVETGAPETPFIRLRGKWLAEHGFEIKKPAYIYEIAGALVISAKPIQPEEMPTLESIRRQYKAAGIPTERKSK